MSAQRIYRIKDLALRIDRKPLTIKRWEKSGLIPLAKKDSRGWRIYSEDEIRDIQTLVKETNYFHTGDEQANFGA